MALNVGELVAYLRADDTKLAVGLAGARGKLKAFASAVGPPLAAAGATGAAMLGAGIAENLDIGAGRAKLAAQLGLSAQDSARIGAVAGQVYASGYGESLSDVNDAIRSVATNLGNVSTMSSADLQEIASGAMGIAETFDQDVSGATRAASKLISTGLAKDSKQAFDILTRGFQVGLDSSDDFLDTMNEYSPHFSKLGIDGPRALSLLSAGLKAGARDTDAVADAFKEFSIRAIDGSDTTKEGFKAIGLDADKAAKQIGKGGPAAAQMTQKVLEGLLKIKDPIKRNAAGVALFGTQWEDTVQKTLPALARAEEGMEGVQGATQRMADTIHSSGKAKIEGMKRAIDGWVQSQIESSGAVGATVAAVSEFGGPALAMAGSLGMVAAGLSAVNAGAAITAIRTAIVSGATKVWAGAQWLLNAAMSANPMTIIILVILALVAAIVIAWKKSDAFRNAVTAAWNAILNAGRSAFNGVVSALTSAWNSVKSATSSALGAVTGTVRSGVGAVMSVIRGVGAIPGIIGGAFRSAATAAAGAIGSLISTVRSIPGRITGALGDLGGLLTRAGRAVIQGLIDGIRGMLGELRSMLGSVTNMIPDWKGPADRDRTLLVGNGRLIMQGLVAGLEDGQGIVERSLTNFTGDLGRMAPLIPGQRSAGAALAGAGRGPADVTLRLGGDRLIVELMRRLVLDHGGGSVQLAFGGRGVAA